MTMTAEQTTRIEKMEAELHEQRQIFIQGKGRGLTPGSLVSCHGISYQIILFYTEIVGLILFQK